MGGKRFVDVEKFETEVRNWVRQQSIYFYAAGFDAQMYQYWWMICREINVFQVTISHVLRFILICLLYTDSPSYIHKSWASEFQKCVLLGRTGPWTTSTS
jgi:hypothetical protein